MLTKKQKKIWRIVRILIVLTLVYFVIARPVRLLLIGMDGLAQQLPDTKNILPEYRDLLDSLSNAELKANHTFNSRKRLPVSVGTFKNKYVFIFFKINSSYPNLLDKSIFVKNDNTNFSSRIDYVSVIYGGVESLIDFNFAIAKKPNAQNVYLTIDGDSTRTIVRNDSLALFYVHCRKASIKYSKDSINDIVISTKEDEVKGDEVAINLAFIKHNGSLYLIVMSAIHEEQPLTPDDLLKILKQ